MLRMLQICLVCLIIQFWKKIIKFQIGINEKIKTEKKIISETS